MQQYLDLMQKIIQEGIWTTNRTETKTLTIFGECVKYNLQEGFPILTTRKVNYKSSFAEMLCFLRGYSNNQDFERIGTKVWKENSEADYWTSNPHYKGLGDLGRIYGVQARKWNNNIDQLKNVIENIQNRNDNRRLIVTHWNPAELDQMALPPCHLLYQFNIDPSTNTLHLSLYQRSCDFPLGAAFNVPGYAWLVSLISHITGMKPGTLTHFMNNVHIYENQLSFCEEQLNRTPLELPTLQISERIKTFEDLETIATIEDFNLINYNYHPNIKYPFTV